MKTDTRTQTIQTAWEVVEEHIDEARLIAWDTCHKIYLALDDIEAEWFRENYECVVEGSTDLMMKTLRTWYAESCDLKFIQGVRHNADNPNDGFISLIDQGARDENDRCDECGYFDCGGGCVDDGPWECEYGHFDCSQYEGGPCSNEHDSE